MQAGLHIVQPSALPSQWGFKPDSLPVMGASPDAVICHVIPSTGHTITAVSDTVHAVTRQQQCEGWDAQTAQQHLLSQLLELVPVAKQPESAYADHHAVHDQASGGSHGQHASDVDGIISKLCLAFEHMSVHVTQEGSGCIMPGAAPVHRGTKSGQPGLHRSTSTLHTSAHRTSVGLARECTACGGRSCEHAGCITHPGGFDVNIRAQYCILNNPQLQTVIAIKQAAGRWHLVLREVVEVKNTCPFQVTCLLLLRMLC